MGQAFEWVVSALFFHLCQITCSIFLKYGVELHRYLPNRTDSSLANAPKAHITSAASEQALAKHTQWCAGSQLNSIK